MGSVPKGCTMLLTLWVVMGDCLSLLLEVMLIVLSAEFGRRHGEYFALSQWYVSVVLWLFSASSPLANVPDPLFWLLHTQLDRIWAAWQAHDPRNRDAIAGGVDQDLNHFDAHPLGTGTPVTADTIIYMAGIGPDAKIKDVFSTTGGYLCYDYAT